MKNFYKPVLSLLVLTGIALQGCDRFDDDVMPMKQVLHSQLNNDNYIISRNQALQLNVLANDVLTASGSLSFRQAAHGIVYSDSNGFWYAPNQNYQGRDQFYYRYITDKASDSALVSVTIDGTMSSAIQAINGRVRFTRDSDSENARLSSPKHK